MKPEDKIKAQEDEIATLKAQIESAKVPKTSFTSVPTAVDLDEYKGGKFKDINTGEVFQLKVVEADELGRTHKLKNQEHFVEVTPEGFRARFEKP